MGTSNTVAAMQFDVEALDDDSTSGSHGKENGDENKIYDGDDDEEATLGPDDYKECEDNMDLDKLTQRDDDDTTMKDKVADGDPTEMEVTDQSWCFCRHWSSDDSNAFRTKKRVATKWQHQETRRTQRRNNRTRQETARRPH
jgi:hypothetical protein